jgi:phosphatidylserine/phosphatidylglycerophosphate/cardiolipin synthase-like enzyme
LHWKCVVVRNRKGTSANLGGIDLNRNRLDGPEHLPSNTKYHDVNVRIQGPAAADVTNAFRDRYVEAGLGSHPTDSIRPTITTPPGVPATQMVGIARTFQAGIGAGFQRWSPNGDQTIWATMQQAIRRARRYIYIEDQYMVGPSVRDELMAAVQSFTALDVILVIPEVCEDFKVFADQSGYDRARYLFFKDLIALPRVTALYVPADKYFLHSKVKIYDDVFAQVGTANVNNRSLTNDAEIDAFILDGRIEGGARKFARDLRIRLWAEHLGMPLNGSSFARLNNIDYAIELMKNRPRTSRLLQYSVKNVGSSYETGWDKVDPIGS